MDNFIEQLKQSGLTGRSGSNFPVWKKWEAVKNPSAGSGQAPTDKKFVVCNGSEGEPGVFKDEYILQNYAPEIINGIKIALQETGAQTAYIYLNKDYYQKFKTKLSRLTENLAIELFEKPSGYLAGEETSLLNAIEGKCPEPRIKPPFPTEIGLWGKPTLINNVETFYWVSKIAQGEYQNKRFYCVSGDVPLKGVFELPENYTIEQVLRETRNYPAPSTSSGQGFPFFVQVGGGAIGEILLEKELNQPVKGLASIIIFNKETTDPLELMKKWVEFLINENCDKCTPCREGLYRVKEILQESRQGISPERRQTLQDIFEALEKTSLCPLGRTAYLPFKSAIAKLL